MCKINNNWVIENLQKALGTWNSKLAEIWGLLTTSPENFKGGEVWAVIQQIYGYVQAVGYALLVLFFFAGVIRSTIDVHDLRRPEAVFKLFLRFAIAKLVMDYGMELLIHIMQIPQGMVSHIIAGAGLDADAMAELPAAIQASISELGFLASIPLWFVALLSRLIITVLAFILILTVYGRFFRFYMFAALAPIPLAGLAAHNTQNMALGFLRNFSGVCMEVVTIAIACLIYTKMVSAPPDIDAAASAVTQVWDYTAEIIFNMLLLVGTVKMVDIVTRQILGGG